MSSYSDYSTAGATPRVPLPISSTRDPTTSDKLSPDGSPYMIGIPWINTTLAKNWQYAGSGNWTLLGSGSVGGITSITGDSGGAEVPSSGNFTLSGTTHQILVAGSANTETFSLVGPYTPATYTAHGVLIGEGTSSIVAASVGTTGQVLTGSTGADPAFAALGTNSSLTSTGVVLGGGAGALTATSAFKAGQALIAATTGGAPAPTYISDAQVTYVPAFNAIPSMSANTGGVAVVTLAAINVWSYPQYGAYFEQHNTVATSIIAPTLSTTLGKGLNIGSLTGANAKIVEITEGNSVNSKNAFVIGTSPAFYVQATFSITTLNTVQNVALGFRKVQNYQETSLATYTDYALIGVLSTAGEFEIQTQITTGGETDTDTTQAAVAATNFTVKVLVSSGGVVTYTINGSAPTVTAAYTFTSALTVIPMIYCAAAAGAHGEVDLIAYQCGLQ